MVTESKGKKTKIKGNGRLIGELRSKKTLAQIAEEQGVKPFDISKSGSNWPKEADFEEFYNSIQSGRKYGRKYK